MTSELRFGVPENDPNYKYVGVTYLPEGLRPSFAWSRHVGIGKGKGQADRQRCNVTTFGGKGEIPLQIPLRAVADYLHAVSKK